MQLRAPAGTEASAQTCIADPDRHDPFQGHSHKPAHRMGITIALCLNALSRVLDFGDSTVR